MFIERTIVGPADIFAGAKTGPAHAFNIANAVRAAFRAIAEAYERRKTVRDLRGLSDHLLDDIGLDKFGLDQATRDAIAERNCRSAAL